jgi:hypothetical protein
MATLRKRYRQTNAPMPLELVITVASKIHRCAG